MRIFWFSMHRVLMETELPRLRGLGYEVFVPAYLSLLTDQSAVREWDSGQATSLPPPVFARLAGHNFFDGPIPRDIAEILNTYFDACLVTMNVDWVTEMAKVFDGKLIFRTYGQVGVLSEMLEERGLLPILTERDNFWWMPHADEVTLHEHDWFKERSRVVPYCVTPDVKQRQGTWQKNGRRNEIMAMSPNIANPYYFRKYRFLKKNFSDLPVRIYGVQTTHVWDAQVAGTLPRGELLNRYETAAGYLYSYQDPDVCYLPPIEMMVIGGPVVFLANSLLARYFTSDPPGLARTVEEARKKCGRLLANDRDFAAEVIRAQAPAVARYDPEKVWPLFDAAMTEVLSPAGNNHGVPVTFSSRRGSTDRPRIYLLLHATDGEIQFKDGFYRSENPLLKRLNSLVRSIVEKTPYDVILTCRPGKAGLVHGFFKMAGFRDRVLVGPLDLFASKALNGRMGLRRRMAGFLKPVFLRAKRMSRFLMQNATSVHGWLGIIFHAFRERMDKLLMAVVVDRASVRRSLARTLVQGINEDLACTAVLVPCPVQYPEIAGIQEKAVFRIADPEAGGTAVLQTRSLDGHGAAFNEQQILESLHVMILKSSASRRRI